MAPDNNANMVEKSKTKSGEILERIDEKIGSLYKILDSVYLKNSEPRNDKEAIRMFLSSPLLNRLQDIERRITDLLEGIRI